MAMLRSAIFRQSARASSFFGNVGPRSPASSLTSRRNYFSDNPYDLRKEDIPEWNTREFLFGAVGGGLGLVFYHK